jgi:hypothetical protein
VTGCCTCGSVGVLDGGVWVEFWISGGEGIRGEGIRGEGIGGQGIMGEWWLWSLGRYVVGCMVGVGWGAGGVKVRGVIDETWGDGRGCCCCGVG